jgi:hypothetical protein
VSHIIRLYGCPYRYYNGSLVGSLFKDTVSVTRLYTVDGRMTADRWGRELNLGRPEYNRRELKVYEDELASNSIKSL